MSEPAPLPPPVAFRSAHELGLPEVDWTYRRIYTYGRSLFLAGLLAYIVHLLRDAPNALERIAWGLIAMMVVKDLLYTGGATMTDLRRLAVVKVGPFFSLGRQDGGAT